MRSLAPVRRKVLRLKPFLFSWASGKKRTAVCLIFGQMTTGRGIRMVIIGSLVPDSPGMFW